MITAVITVESDFVDVVVDEDGHCKGKARLSTKQDDRDVTDTLLQRITEACNAITIIDCRKFLERRILVIRAPDYPDFLIVLEELENKICTIAFPKKRTPWCVISGVIFIEARASKMLPKVPPLWNDCILSR